jgi:hypothetical protein
MAAAAAAENTHRMGRTVWRVSAARLPATGCSTGSATPAAVRGIIVLDKRLRQEVLLHLVEGRFNFYSSHSRDVADARLAVLDVWGRPSSRHIHNHPPQAPGRWQREALVLWLELPNMLLATRTPPRRESGRNRLCWDASSPAAPREGELDPSRRGLLLPPARYDVCSLGIGRGWWSICSRGRRVWSARIAPGFLAALPSVQTDSSMRASSGSSGIEANSAPAR